MKSRTWHACFVVEDTLWVTGYGRANIETIIITNIQSQQWIEHYETNRGVGMKGVVANDIIYIWNSGANKYGMWPGVSQAWQTIDTSTGVVSAEKWRLPERRRCAAPIVVDNVIYLFGGQTTGHSIYRKGSTSLDSWITLDLLSICSMLYVLSLNV